MASKRYVYEGTQMISLELQPGGLQNPNKYNVFSFGDKKNAKVIEDLDAIIDFAVEMGHPVPARYLTARREIVVAPSIAAQARVIKSDSNGRRV